MTDELTVLGHDVRGPSRTLECFAAPDAVAWVALASDEVTSMCPVTGQPDFSRVEIGYRQSSAFRDAVPSPVVPDE